MNLRLAIPIIVLVCLGLLNLTPFSPVKVAAAPPLRSFSLIGYISAWNNTSNANPPITVTQGDNVTIHLSSGDGATHLFFIDVDKNGATPDCSGADICSAAFPPSTKVNFLANFGPGTYTYYCSVHPSYMYGSFIVQGPPPPSDFSISSNPTTISATQGSSTTSSLTITSSAGFAGKLNLTATVAPVGPQVSISPAFVTLSSGGSATATLTATTSGSGLYSTPTPVGSYTITVKASNSSLSRSTTVSLTVASSSSSPSGSASLPLDLIVGGVVGAIVVIGVAAYLVRRRSPSTV